MGDCCFVGADFQFGRMKKVLKVDGGDGYLGVRQC